jgi:pimeloyl-ACP methyl ester carboxylesterase
VSESSGATAVALIHGVGFGPATFAPVARELRRAGPVLVLERRGYGSRAGLAPAERVEDHVEDLVAALDDAGVARALVAGCSGGATVALAAALLVPDRVTAAVAHEPAVGSLAPGLLDVVAAALARGGGLELLRTLAGPDTWARLSPDDVADLEAQSEVVEADARAFMCWEPPLTLADDAARIISSVGDRSDALRRGVARRLEQRAHARVVVVPRCGHLAQLDAPRELAAVVTSTFVNRTTQENLA